MLVDRLAFKHKLFLDGLEHEGLPLCDSSSIDSLPAENALNQRKTWAHNTVSVRMLEFWKSLRFTVAKFKAKTDSTSLLKIDVNSC